MTTSEIMYFIIVSVVTIVLIIGVFVFSYRYNDSIGKASQKKSVVRNKFPTKTKNDKEYMISELVSGGIKCHKIPNSAKKYSAHTWVKKMLLFMKQPSFDVLMKLKGNDIDGD